MPVLPPVEPPAPPLSVSPPSPPSATTKKPPKLELPPSKPGAPPAPTTTAYVFPGVTGNMLAAKAPPPPPPRELLPAFPLPPPPPAPQTWTTIAVTPAGTVYVPLEVKVWLCACISHIKIKLAATRAMAALNGFRVTSNIHIVLRGDRFCENRMRTGQQCYLQWDDAFRRQ